jgi:hypothetical protein
MKLTASNLPRAQCGNVLIMTLVFFGIVALTTAGYLSLAKSRTLIRARSTAWNSAIPVLEAGIEEGFTHLKDDSGAPTANGWTSGTVGGQPVLTKSRTFPDGSYFSVTLYTALKNSPLIYSSGFVPVPLGTGYISRTVRVAVTSRATFANAIAARQTITLSGSAVVDSSLSGSAVVDSFDSSNTNGSTGGRYDPARRSANANVVTDSQAKPAVNVMTAHIYGQVGTGPGGTVTTSGGAVGDLAWNATHSGIQPGSTHNDMNVACADAALPSPFLPMTPVPGKVGSTNFNYLLDSGSYQLSTLTLSGGQAMYVRGNAVLYSVGNITVSGSGYIYLAPDASLQLYGGGSSSVISGGGVVNGTGNAANFSYYGLTNNTTLNYSGTAAFIGTVYAPQANFTLSGSGGMCGAAIVNSYVSSGGSSFHYDQALGGSSYMALTSYTEL